MTEGSDSDDNVVPFARPERAPGVDARPRRTRGQPRESELITKGPGYAVNGGGYNWGYKPGAVVQCRIDEATQGGFNVTTVRDQQPGYLSSRAKHQSGDVVLASFVCLDKNRILFSERFTAGKHGSDGSAHPKYGPDWSAHLDSLDPAYSQSSDSDGDETDK